MQNINANKQILSQKAISTRDWNAANSARRTTTTSLSPDQTAIVRPRKVNLPNILDPDLLIPAKSSKQIIAKIKTNLADLISINNLNEGLIKWNGKFTVEIMDLARIELVQVEGISLAFKQSLVNARQSQSTTLQGL